MIHCLSFAARLALLLCLTGLIDRPLRAQNAELLKIVHGGYSPDAPSPYRTSAIANIGNIVIFRVCDAQACDLWRTDGTPDGTFSFKHFGFSTARTVESLVPGNSAAVMNGVAYFPLDDGSHGQEIWRSDGTEAGTWLVRDIYPGGTGSNAFWFQVINGTLFFTAADPEHGVSLWRSNGTLEGTTLADPTFGPLSKANPGQGFVECGAETYFFAPAPMNLLALWMTDLSPEGTKQVTTSEANGGLNFPGFLTCVSNVLYFTATTGMSHQELSLWRTNGTPSGTLPLKSIPDSLSSIAQVFGTAENGVYLLLASSIFVRSSPHIEELWTSKGVPGDARRIAVFDQDQFSYLWRTWNDEFYFATKPFSAPNVAGGQLWRSDGTSSGTVSLPHALAPQGWTLFDLFGSAKHFFFFAYDEPNGQSLWMVDGHGTDTRVVHHISQRNINDSYCLPVAESYLFCLLNDGIHGLQPWAVPLTTRAIVSTSPPDAGFSVDGQRFASSQTLNWTFDEQHTLSAAEIVSVDAGTRYLFRGWSDGGSSTHTVSIPMGGSASYTATYSKQYLMSVGANPPSAGVVTGGGWYEAGAPVALTARAYAGYRFTGFSVAPLAKMTGPQSIVANFEPIPASPPVDSGSVPPPPQGLRFVPIAPCRVVDTRSNSGPFGAPVMAAGESRVFPLPSGNCGLPVNAKAYSLNFTVVPDGPLGYLTAWPTGVAQPLASTLNAPEGNVTANSAVIPAGASGSIQVFVTDRTHVIIDVNGYFAPSDTTAGMVLHTIAPCRVADTRAGQGISGAFGPPSFSAGESRDLALPAGRCGLPPQAQAYALNVTVVPKGPLGYLTMSPSGQPRPFVSTLNSPTGRIAANAAIVPAGGNGAISVFATDPTDVVIDVNGYFTAPEFVAMDGSPGLLLTTLAPCRVADTRTGEGVSGAFGSPSIVGGAPRTIPVPQGRCSVPSAAQAYLGNVTVVPHGPLQYLTVWPSGQSQPFVSTLNSLGGIVTANGVIIPSGANGAVSVFATDATDFVFDLNGYFLPQ